MTDQTHQEDVEFEQWLAPRRSATPEEQRAKCEAEIARIEALTPEEAQAEWDEVNARMNASRERFRENNERQMREWGLLPE